MLIELAISDFAIIDHVRLQFSPAFNVLTGETGAGKSIIIDALNTLRGERADTSFVRSGSANARVEGIFALEDRQDLRPVLEEYGLTDEDDQLILSREISASTGRSVARINGRAVSLAVLREIGSRLIDIHGQHESLSLFQIRNHLDMLDRYGGLLEARERVGALVEQINAVRGRLADIRRQEGRRHERIEELEYLLEELGAAKLRAGEEESLARERSVLQNASKITGLSEGAYRLLKLGGQSAESRRPPATPVIDTMEEIANAIGELLRLDPSVDALHEQVLDVRYRLDDIAAALRVYREGLDFEPGRLEEIEERLALLRQLNKKYRVDGSEGLLGLVDSAQAELETLQHSAEHMAGLEAEEGRLCAELATAAGALSAQRKKAGEELSRRIERAMGDLAMPHVRFAAQVDQTPDPNGVACNGATVAFDRSGIDKVEFLLSPNPGEPLKPLAKIASGGESSRLLLAMKSILSAVDMVPTLVFDEVDVGVGGRSGQVVGEKLWGLTTEHQVLCITHLPQIAAFADAHYVISKRVEGQRTQTRVRALSWEERCEEIAAMLDGQPISEASRRTSQEMLSRAESHKQQPAKNTQEASIGLAHT